MESEDSNIPLFRALQDGRRSFRDVAEELGVTENTVRARVKRLLESGSLEIRALIDPDAVAGHSSAMVGVKVKSADLVSAGRQFMDLKGVVSVRVVTGRYDLLVEVLLKDGFGLLEFYTHEVAKIDDVQDFETFVVYKGFNHKLPYVL